MYLSQDLVREFYQLLGLFFRCRPRCVRYSNDGTIALVTSPPAATVDNVLAVCEDIAPEKQNPLFAGDVPAKARRSDAGLGSADSICRLY